MESVNQQKKGGAQTTKETPAARPSTAAKEFTNQAAQTDQETPEGDEREWQAPDVKPTYPTDVQAKASTAQTDNLADFAMNQDENTESLGTENPGLMNRH